VLCDVSRPPLPCAIAVSLFVDLFVEAHQHPPKQIILDLDANDDPLHRHRRDDFFPAMAPVLGPA
jgi:hypothetical protein